METISCSTKQTMIKINIQRSGYTEDNSTSGRTCSQHMKQTNNKMPKISASQIILFIYKAYIYMYKGTTYIY